MSKYAIKWLLLGLLILSTGQSWGLYRDSMPVPDSPYVLGFDRPGNRYVVITEEYLFQMQADSTHWTRQPLLWRASELRPDFNDMLLRGNADNTFLPKISGGLVYELMGDSLLRLDRSFGYKAQFGSIKWMMSDTIVSYGGYGLWNFQNFFTFYSPANRGYNMLEIASDRPLPPKRSYAYGWYDALNRDFFVFGGLSNNNVARLPSDNHSLRDVWTINLSTRRWQKLGQLSSGVQIQHSRPFVFLEERLIILSDSVLYDIDFHQNSFRTKTINTSLGHRFFPTGMADYNPNSGEVIYVSNENPNRIYIRSLNELYSDNIREIALYRNYRALARGSILLVLLIGGVVMVYLFIRRRSRTTLPAICNLKDHTIRFNTKAFDLDEGEVKLLTLLSSEDRRFLATW